MSEWHLKDAIISKIINRAYFRYVWALILCCWVNYICRLLCIIDLLLSQRTEKSCKPALQVFYQDTQSVSSLQPGYEVSWGGRAVYIPQRQTTEVSASVTFNLIYCTAKNETDSSKEGRSGSEMSGKRKKGFSLSVPCMSHLLTDASSSWWRRREAYCCWHSQ